MVYRVYRVYGYFQKSIYGIYFTFPTTRSGGWEMDLLYRVLETCKKPDLSTHRPPSCVGNTPPPTLCISVWWWNSLGVSYKIAFWRDFVCIPIHTTWVPIHSYSPLLLMATIKSHQTRCGGISQRKKHLLQQEVSCSVYISVMRTATRRAHDRQPLVIRHLGV